MDHLKKKLTDSISEYFKGNYSFLIRNGIYSLFCLILIGLTYKGMFLIHIKTPMLTKLFKWIIYFFNHWDVMLGVWIVATLVAVAYDYIFYFGKVRNELDKIDCLRKFLTVTDNLYSYKTEGVHYGEGVEEGYYVLLRRLWQTCIWLFAKGCFIFVIVAYVMNYRYFALNLEISWLMYLFTAYSVIMCIGSFSILNYAERQIILDEKELKEFPVLKKEKDYYIVIYYRKGNKEYRVFHKQLKNEKDCSSEIYYSDSDIYFDNFEDSNRHLTYLLEE